MRDCIVLGSGRSGTSLATGILADAGYFTGTRHWRPTTANPKGFFEDRRINAINERILAPHTPPTLPWLLGRFVPGRLGWLQRWLAIVPVGTSIRASRSLERRMARATASRPFCLKDPRFCYTLPAWRPHLGDAAYLCVFRHPAVTLTSLRKEISRAPNLRNVDLDDEHLVAMWCAMYQHILETHRHLGTWLFTHYDQVFSGACVDEWKRVLGVELSRDFVDRDLRRSAASPIALPAAALEIYTALCELAHYVEPMAAPEDTAGA